MTVLSVIVPVHQVREYLTDCLDSILGQPFADVELVAVDDASTDGCAEILAGYAARDPRVRVLTLPTNRGLGAARNAGLARAVGEYAWFVDADDWQTCRERCWRSSTGSAGTRPDLLVTAYTRHYPNGGTRHCRSPASTRAGPCREVHRAARPRAAVGAAHHLQQGDPGGDPPTWGCASGPAGTRTRLVQLSAAARPRPGSACSTGVATRTGSADWGDHLHRQRPALRGLRALGPGDGRARLRRKCAGRTPSPDLPADGVASAPGARLPATGAVRTGAGSSSRRSSSGTAGTFPPAATAPRAGWSGSSTGWSGTVRTGCSWRCGWPDGRTWPWSTGSGRRCRSRRSARRGARPCRPFRRRTAWRRMAPAVARGGLASAPDRAVAAGGLVAEGVTAVAGDGAAVAGDAGPQPRRRDELTDRTG